MNAQLIPTEAPKTNADKIRDLIAEIGPLTRLQVSALLPITYAQVDGLMRPMAKLGTLVRNDDGTFSLGRPPMDRSEAAKEQRKRERYKRAHANRRQREGKMTRAEWLESIKGRVIPKSKVPKPPRMRRSPPLSDAVLARRRDFANRLEANAAAAQEMNAKHLGLRDMPTDVRPCTDTWLAQHRGDPKKYQALRNGDVSPASRFQRIEVSA